MAKTNTSAEQADAVESTLGYYLVVRHAFGQYRKGDAIRDPAEIERVLQADGNRHNVHRVMG